MKTKESKAREIISQKKITFLGDSLVRKTSYYSVAGVSISVVKERKLNTDKFEVDCINDWEEVSDFNCSCKDCVVCSIPRGTEPRCTYVLALKKYLKTK